MLYERALEVRERVRIVSKQVGFPAGSTVASLRESAPHPILRTCVSATTGETIFVECEPDLEAVRFDSLAFDNFGVGSGTDLT